MSARVLVTGAAGFAGGHLVDALVASGTAGVIAWRRPASARRGAAPGAIEWRDVDVLDAHAVRRALEDSRPAIIYHCAGAPHIGQSWRNVRHTLETNVLGTHHVLEADRVLDLRAKILVTGSAAVYRASAKPLSEDDPVSPGTPYGLSKLAQEQLALSAAAEGQRVFVTRSFNHIGPRQSPDFAASSFARQIALAEAGKGPSVLKVGNLSPQRDFLDVRDTVRAYIAIVERGRPGRAYNVCSGVPMSMQSLLDRLTAAANLTLSVEPDPGLYRPADAPTIVGDGTLLRTVTGWQPLIPLDRTLADLLGYWRKTVRD